MNKGKNKGKQGSLGVKDPGLFYVVRLAKSSTLPGFSCVQHLFVKVGRRSSRGVCKIREPFVILHNRTAMHRQHFCCRIR